MHNLKCPNCEITTKCIVCDEKAQVVFCQEHMNNEYIVWLNTFVVMTQRFQRAYFIAGMLFGGCTVWIIRSIIK